MAYVPQYSWLCSLRPIKNGVSSTTTNPRNCTFKPLKVSSSSNSESSPPTSSDSQEPDPGKTDPVKLAFAKAKAYKKSFQSDPISKINRNPVLGSNDIGKRSDGLVEEVNNCGNQVEGVPIAVKLAMEKSKGVVGDSQIVEEREQFGVSGSAEKENENDGSNSEDKNDGIQDVPIAFKLAMEKAKKYKTNKGVDGRKSVQLSEKNGGNLGNGFVEKRTARKEELSISSIDFIGLGFSDKKMTRGLPAGLVPVDDPFPEGDLPEVEIIVGDTSKFGDVTVSEPKPTEERTSDVYKPAVSTWGVFPRPSNISKTYGGGRTIRPGEVLETAEDKAAKQSRTRQLLADYKRRTGLTIDPRLKSECEKALKDGDFLMELGNLKEALPFYEKVMEKLPFQSELHGLAAIQWSICQDSLSRSNEARIMYEKLQAHPNVQVSKKARQFMFGFQAMEMMKVTSSPSRNPGYQNFFEAFIEDKANYALNETEGQEGALSQALPYIIFLVSPIFIVLLIAAQRGI